MTIKLCFKVKLLLTIQEHGEESKDGGGRAMGRWDGGLCGLHIIHKHS